VKALVQQRKIAGTANIKGEWLCATHVLIRFPRRHMRERVNTVVLLFETKQIPLTTGSMRL
jgi:hypothetical protein